jgi:hypothetical protein
MWRDAAERGRYEPGGDTVKRLVFIAKWVQTKDGLRCRPRLLWALPGLRFGAVRPSDAPRYPRPALLLRAGVHVRLPHRAAWFKGGRTLLLGGVRTDWITSLQET